MVPQNSRNLFDLFFSLSVLLPFASTLSINFSVFDQTTSDSIEFQRDAFLNQVIQLTRNDISGNLTQSIGRAVYRQPLLLWDSDTGKLTDFTTHFSFKINPSYPSVQTVYGDGLAFFLSPYPSVIPDSSAGGFLGLFSNYSALNASRNHLVAVEFDTYPNVWDPINDHVGINVNSIKSVANVTWSTGLKDGRTANAWVSYNSSTKNLSVFLTYDDNPVFRGDSSLSYVVDLSKILPETVAIGFSAATGSASEIHYILSWDFSSNLVAKKKSKIGLIVGLVVAVGVAMLIFGMVWFILWCKRAKRPANHHEELDSDVSIDEEFEKERGPKRFTFSELVAATYNFAEEGKLGKGGFGEVYKGFLNDEVAIKRVSAGSREAKKQYISEVKTIGRLRHRNLVQLVGWCHGQGEFLLVYKFMPNGSLDYHLYSQERFLAWPVRCKIALDLASALLYLHEGWEQCVVHRDVKPSNVMLDSNFEAKLGDFGLARLVDHEIGSQTTSLAGTPGYLAPESVTIGRATKESDVYSFGIVALEIACGRRPLEPREKLGKVKLVEWVWELYGRGMILEARDERLKMDFEEKEMERLMVVGLWCAHPDHEARPSIRQAINVLNLEAPLPDLPPKMPVPMFIAPSLDVPKVTYTSSVEGLGGMSSVSSGFTANSSRLSMSSG